MSHEFTPTGHNATHFPHIRHFSAISFIFLVLCLLKNLIKYTDEYLRFFFWAFIGQASIQSPQLEHEYISASAKPLRGFVVFKPAFLNVISSASVGICIYLLNGMAKKNNPNTVEYAHQVGRI